MENKNLGSRGFIMMSVVFLTLVVSFAAVIFLNGSARVKNSNSALRFTALNLMQEQFAMLESRAAHGDLPVGNFSFLGASEDLTSYNLAENFPVKFKVKTTVKNHVAYENLRNVTVQVEWTFNNKDFEIESEKIMRVQNSE